MPRLVRIVQVVCFFLLMACAGVVQAGADYVDNQDGTISDPQHGTMWQKGDDGIERSWQEALTYCENLEFAGHDDWLLPKAYQLEGLIDTANSPAIAPVFAVKASYYWSATGSTSSTDSAKYVNFFYGNAYTNNKSKPYYAICVREATSLPGKGLAAVFTGAPEGGKQLSIRFTATITGGSEPYFYEWDFGDGSTSGAKSPTHEFAKDGQYKVLLTVSDNDGAIFVTNQQLNLPLADIPAVGAEKEESAATASDVKDKVPVVAEATPPGTEPAVKDEGEDQRAGKPEALPSRLPEDSGRGNGGQERAPGKVSLVSPNAALQGFVDLSASGQGPTFKDGALGHGLLAYSFANAMAGDGDWNKDGSVTSSEVQAYLDQAIKSLSKGQQKPVATAEGADFGICASQGGSTYVLALGIARDLAGKSLVAGQDAELVRKAVEEKCQRTKTMMLTADHANRQDILQALLQIGSMVTASDTLIVYIGAASGQENGRLNWYVNDTQKELPSLTGIYHDDLVQVLKTMPIAHLLVLGEKN
ncbi:MAG: DUF1566 domain-containing protein [Desulfobulbaceae bacterium]|nr:DUF1566 domain-containing protein [Desulfobulbaceae bacterium]